MSVRERKTVVKEVGDGLKSIAWVVIATVSTLCCTRWSQRWLRNCVWGFSGVLSVIGFVVYACMVYVCNVCIHMYEWGGNKLSRCMFIRFPLLFLTLFTDQRLSQGSDSTV